MPQSLIKEFTFELSGAIGLACGLGIWSVALMASSAGVVILWLLRRMQYATGLKDD